MGFRNFFFLNIIGFFFFLGAGQKKNPKNPEESLFFGVLSKEEKFSAPFCPP